MAKQINVYEPSSPEERVIQNHHSDLQHAIIYPLIFASKLLQEGVVSRTLVSEVNTQGRSQLQNSTAILTAVTASIHSKPDQFQVFMSVLEDSPESANLATRMRNELSTLKLAPVPTERLMERKGRLYTVSAEYKRDFILLQDKFGRLFHSFSKAANSQVPVDNLKDYLCETFPEFKILLQEASTTDDVMKAVRNQSSLTDVAYFDRINDRFNLQVTQEIDRYCDTLDSFCQHTLDNHTYVRSFREDYPRYILSSDKIVFQLQWKANEKTLKDIRDVLRMSFGHLADRVQIVVIEDGSVVVVCWAPRYLMEELVRQASESVHSLAEMGVVKLTVGGGTKVNIEKLSLSRRLSQSSESQITSSRFKVLDLTQPHQQATQSDVSSGYYSHVTSTQSDVSSGYYSHVTFTQSDVSSGYYSHRTSTQSESLSRKPKTISYLKKQSLPCGKPSYLTKLSSPRGMVISQEGHLIVAEHYNHCITIIDTASGEVIDRLGQYGSGQVEFMYLEGVALTQDGYIIVADTLNDRLQVLTVEGAFVAAVGSRGSQPLQFNYPYDVAVHHNGKIFVTDHNHRVQVLNPDLSYSHCFGSKGDKLGKLNEPRGIVIDQDGMVYVGDYGNNRIHKFSPEGDALAVFDNMRSCGLCTCIGSNNILYVADWVHDTVCVYNTSGEFLGYIGNSDGSSFDGPRFIVTDNDRLYISDNNGVITYKCYQQFYY